MIPRKTQMKRQKGAALVELALILPVAFLILSGLVDFGLALRRLELLSQVVRQGARSAAAYSLEDDSPSANGMLCPPGRTSDELECGNETSPPPPIIQATLQCLSYRETKAALISSGLDPKEWAITTSLPALSEGAYTAKAAHVSVKRAKNSGCILCYLGIVGVNFESAESSFQLEGKCDET